MSRRDRNWLNLAAKIAAKSDCRTKHGCVIVSGGRLISTGKNTFRNHPRFIHDYANCSFHAEISAIRSCRSVIKNATIYVARVNNHGIRRLSKPCNKCEIIIKTVGIRRVIWSIDELVKMET